MKMKNFHTRNVIYRYMNNIKGRKKRKKEKKEKT